MIEEEGVQDVNVDKEGAIYFYSKKKWKSKWGVLSGGAFYYKSKKKSKLNGPILLKDATISIHGDHKKIALQIVSPGGETFIFALEDEDKRKEWMAALEENKQKEVLYKKRQSTAMRVKKNVGGKAATSSGGKGLIKEFLGKDGASVLDIVKKIVTIHENKKKAEDVENAIIRIAVKVILLWKNKDITGEDIAVTVPGVKAIWSDVIDFCEMSFAYDPAKIKEHGERLQVDFCKLLSQNVSEKNLSKMKDVMNYLVAKELLDKLFADEAQEELKKELNRILRGGWIAVFKNDKQ